MANPEHLEIVKQGAKVWNQWRVENVRVDVELEGADLSNASLYGADLDGAEMFGSTLFRARLADARLAGARLTRSFLLRADLRGADLTEALLNYANLAEADLSGAKLVGANLTGANFRKTNLEGAHVKGAAVTGTVFGENDLSAVSSLDDVIHYGPSSIGIDTIYLSKGKIPEVFLRGCGVPDDFITYARSLATAQNPIQYYSCFISFSSKDQEFAERLYSDLQSKSVRVWFAPHHMKTGARIRPTIDESIRIYDKLLLVLSEASVSSQWVEQEVETALARERESEGMTVLFPVRIDDAVMESKAGWPALLKNTRNVGDP